MKHVFPFVIAGASGKEDMEIRRSVFVVIDRRALEESITFKYTLASTVLIVSDKSERTYPSIPKAQDRIGILSHCI